MHSIQGAQVVWCTWDQHTAAADVTVKMAMLLLPRVGASAKFKNKQEENQRLFTVTPLLLCAKPQLWCRLIGVKMDSG